jgi:hypothetical protein
MASGITSPCETAKRSGTVVDDSGFFICCGANVLGVVPTFVNTNANPAANQASMR